MLVEGDDPQLAFRVESTRGVIYDPEIPMRQRVANRATARELQGWLDGRTWARDGRRFLRALEMRGRALLLREEGRGIDVLREARRVAMMPATARPVARR